MNDEAGFRAFVETHGSGPAARRAAADRRPPPWGGSRADRADPRLPQVGTDRHSAGVRAARHWSPRTSTPVPSTVVGRTPDRRSFRRRPDVRIHDGVAASDLRDELRRPTGRASSAQRTGRRRPALLLRSVRARHRRHPRHPARHRQEQLRPRAGPHAGGRCQRSTRYDMSDACGGNQGHRVSAWPNGVRS